MRGLMKAAGGISCGALLVLAWLMFVTSQAHATSPDNRPPDNRPPDKEGQPINVEAQATSEATATANSTAESVSGSTATSYSEGSTSSSSSEGGSATAKGGSATASNEGVTLKGGDTSVSSETSFNSESNNTNVVLVPNNNTSNCMRVYGISFGNSDGAAGLGIPTRDKACDYEQAADDAAATGQHSIAWYWRCKKKHLYKAFDGETAEAKSLACFNAMRYMMAVPTGSTGYTAEDMLMAQVSKEEYEEQQMLVETRMEQQQNLIESLKADHDDKDAEIERLKRESARLRAEQKQQEQADAARRAAALKALSKKSEEE